MAVTINGVGVLSQRIVEERVGAWHATVEADSDKTITGAVTIDVEGETFVGTVEQGDVEADSRWKGYVVGGKGGLQKVVDGRYYFAPSVRTVLADLARDSGETLSPEIDPTLLAQQFERYSRLEGPAHTQFRQLADELGVDWRITRAGELWFGAETWLPVTAKTIEAEYDPQHRMIEVAYNDDDNDRPVLRPGVTFEGKKIQRVITQADSHGLRQALFFDAETGDSGLWAQIRRVIRETVWPKLQLARVHGARVCTQASDGSVDLALDDPSIGGKFKSVQKVPLAFGLPGTTIKTTTATRLRLFWDAGRPTKPRAGHFDQGTPVDEIALQVATMLRLGSKDTENFVALANLVLTELNDIRTKFDAHTHAVATTGTALAQSGTAAAPLPPMGPAKSVAATKVQAV